jgi:hypothetical protein
VADDELGGNLALPRALDCHRHDRFFPAYHKYLAADKAVRNTRAEMRMTMAVVVVITALSGALRELSRRSRGKVP